MFLNNKTNFWSNYNNFSNFFPKTTIVIYTKLFIVTKIKSFHRPKGEAPYYVLLNPTLTL